MALFNKKTDTAKQTDAVSKKPVKDGGASMKDLYSSTDGAVKAKSGKKISVKSTGRAAAVLVRPLVTEKAANLNAANQYVFVVSDKANKIEVAKAIRELYGVKVEGVNIVNVKGKAVTRGRIKGRRKDIKKAVVTLAKGESIKVYEGV